MVDRGTAITPVAPRSVAGIAAFRDHDRLLAALQGELGVAAPTTPRFVQTGRLTLSCIAPTRYLASTDAGGDLVARLCKSLAGLAAVTDQSDMWEVFHLSGPSVRDVLARLVPIDLAPEMFRVGDVASTRAGHFDVRLWRVADLGYELAASRSYASNLHAIFAAVLRSQDRAGMP